MTGIQIGISTIGIAIEYFLGIYFAVSSIGYSYPGRAFAVDGIRLLIGIVLIVFAAAGLTLIR